MKYFKYVLRNALRNKLRTLLTVLSMCLTLAMMTVLYGYLASQDDWAENTKTFNRVVVMNVQGFAGAVPIAYLDRVRAMAEVDSAVPYSWFGGLYGDEKYASLAQFGTDAKQVFTVFRDDLRIDPAVLAEWQGNRQGCVVDRRTCQRRGWQVGEHIRLKGTYYDYNLDLLLVGMYDCPEGAEALYFHWDYLDEGLKQNNSPAAGNAGILYVKAKSADVIAGLCKAIDEKFANSEHATWTQTEKEFAQIFAKMMGNMQAYIRNVGIAVVISLVFVAANAMAMSMRERTTEIAVLKAIGFQRGLVLVLLLSESVLISMTGGAMGVFVGQGMFFAAHQMMPMFFPYSSVAWWVVILAVATAAVIGLFSGLIPAVFATQRPVVDGLRRAV